jgi:glycosyltransferase involved in cell wall biosynthesis
VSPRIALVVPYLFHRGGIESTARFLCEASERAGSYTLEPISVAISSRDRSSVRLLDPPSWFQGVRIEPRSWRGRDVLHVGALVTELEFQRYRPRRCLTRLLERYDLVQIVAGTPAWALMTRDVKRPVAVQVASVVEEERRRVLARGLRPYTLWLRLMTRVTARLERLALRHVESVFVLNQPMEHKMRDHAPASRIVFAPHGVDTTVFRPEHDRVPGGSILSVGRFDDPRKNLPLLFEAYGRLRTRMPDAPPLVLAGNTGPSRADWRAARLSGVRDHVVFHEKLARGELAELYRSCALFVLASDQEGLGIVLLEAMASGLPVVATDCGGSATSIVDGQTGYLVRRGDAEAMAAKMLDLLTNQSRRRQMGRNARARAEQEFSLEVAWARYVEQYDRILGT